MNLMRMSAKTENIEYLDGIFIMFAVAGVPQPMNIPPPGFPGFPPPNIAQAVSLLRP